MPLPTPYLHIPYKVRACELFVGHFLVTIIAFTMTSYQDVCVVLFLNIVAQFAIHLGCPIAKHYNESYKLWQISNKFLIKLETSHNIVVTKSQYTWKKVALKLKYDE